MSTTGKSVYQRRELLQIAFATIIAIATAMDLVGKQAHLVHVLLLVAMGLGAGISLGRIIERRRLEKINQPGQAA